MSKFTFKNFPRDYHGLFSYVNKDPWISLSEIGKPQKRSQILQKK